MPVVRPCWLSARGLDPGAPRSRSAACEDAVQRASLNLVPGLRAWRRGNLHPPGAVRDMARLPAQDQKSILACGSVVAPQNSVTLPSRTWLMLATGTSTDLFPREADSVHSATACSSLASTS